MTPDQARMAENNKFRGAQDAFRSMSGAYASPNNFQTGTNNAIFGPGTTYRR